MFVFFFLLNLCVKTFCAWYEHIFCVKVFCARYEHSLAKGYIALTPIKGIGVSSSIGVNTAVSITTASGERLKLLPNTKIAHT